MHSQPELVRFPRIQRLENITILCQQRICKIEGVLRSLDPFLTAINILGVCTFYFNAYENLKHLDPTQQLLSSEMIERQTQAAIS
jgi:TetR/AcrR family transcriptional regulator